MAASWGTDTIQGHLQPPCGTVSNAQLGATEAQLVTRTSALHAAGYCIECILPSTGMEEVLTGVSNQKYMYELGTWYDRQTKNENMVQDRTRLK